MHRYVRAFCAASFAALAVTAVAFASFNNGDGDADALSIAKAATTQFQSLASARAAGYGLLRDKDGIACIAMDSMPEMGAMGVHFANPTFVGDGELNRLRPEALVYQPVARGALHLAAVEYVVIKEAWAKKHAGAPVMFGHRFDFTADGNRFGLPAFYSLHVWLFKHNPAGTFSMWNPLVHCGRSGS